MSSMGNESNEVSSSPTIGESQPTPPLESQPSPPLESQHSPSVGTTGAPPKPPQGPPIDKPSTSASPCTSTNEVTVDGEDDYNDKKLTSNVWLHFKKQKVDGVWKAICNYCQKKLSGDGKNGTSHLHSHFKSCPKRKIRDLRQMVLTTNKSKADAKMVVGTYAYDYNVTRRALANMVILHEYPLSMVEHVGFRKFVASLQPIFNVPSRNTIKSDVMKIYKEGMKKTMNKLDSNQSRVAITTDMWTSDHQKKGYMAITAHYIDDSWTLQKRIIRFCYVPAPHTKDVIVEYLMNCFLDWNLDRKLSTITVDNCSVNDGVVEGLINRISNGDILLGGTFFHMRCCAHILNLIVQDGLAVIGKGVERIRESVIYWSGTPKRVEKFEEAARQLRIPISKKLSYDVKTRWNSTYLMLETAIEYKDVFYRLMQREHGYRSLPKGLPKEEDWIWAAEICDKLKIFHGATEMFSGTKYATANICFPKICEIRLALNQWILSPKEIISTMATTMLIKFEKYWKVINGVMAVACVLDPRYKMCLLEYFYEKIYGLERYEEEIERISKICYELLQEYQQKTLANQGVGSSNASFSKLQAIDCGESLQDYDMYVGLKKRRRAYVKSELDHYLDEEVLPREASFDILAWWKSNGIKYPTLQMIARDIYAIPVSTVASESTFSMGGRLVSCHRSRLHPNTMEALACAQNWLWADIEAECVASKLLPFTTVCDDIDDELGEEDSEIVDLD